MRQHDGYSKESLQVYHACSWAYGSSFAVLSLTGRAAATLDLEKPCGLRQPLASRCQVSTTESGLSEMETMPSCANQSAKSG